MAATCFALASAALAAPNVVVLLADDLGWQDLGCYGGVVETPALDGLASSGARFTAFYSGCAVCSPSRATLLTGRHHIRAGVYSWIHDASQRSHLLESETTLAELLRARGYATAHVGKWHLGLPTPADAKPTPADHGFDHWFATWNNAEPSHHNPRNFLRNGEPVGPLDGYSCQLVADEAIAWLDSHAEARGGAPFFLNVWFHEPHAPLAAPTEIVERYGARDDRAAVYSATIDNTDRAVGRLLAKLRSLAPAEQTLVIYASDNGSYRDDRTGGLRGRKGSNWEGGIRVPGIFCWPGTIPGGREIGAPAGLVDVLPTVCGLLGITPPDTHLDGCDLSPLLRGSESASTFERRQPLFWHLQKSRPIVALRDGDFSLVADPDFDLSTHNMFREEWIPTLKRGGYTNFRLFDLRSDPAQTNDLAGARPELLDRLKAQLLAINASVMADATDWHLTAARAPAGQDQKPDHGRRQRAHNSLTDDERRHGWKLLFDGEEISGWRRYASADAPIDGWVVRDGTLHKPAGVRAGDIMTADRYDNFEFRWEWRLLAGGNNGVKYFITPERKATVGHEYQMLDDKVTDDPYSQTAAFYLIAKPAADKPLHAVGEWNSSRIVVDGDRVEHWLNGEKVLEYLCGSPAVMERVPKTKFRNYPGFGEKVRGHILLTDHKDPCWFRNIKIRVID